MGKKTWKMVKDGVTYFIPLMTAGGDHGKTIETIRGTKKIKKLILTQSNHLMRGHIWRRDEGDDRAAPQRPSGREFNTKHRHSNAGCRGVTNTLPSLISSNWRRRYRPTHV